MSLSCDQACPGTSPADLQEHRSHIQHYIDLGFTEIYVHNVGRNQVDKQDRQAPVPQRTTGNRFGFGDEYGTAKVPERKARPAGSGTRNRMDFGDDGR